MGKLSLNKGLAIAGFLLLLLCAYFREVLLLDINALIAAKGMVTNNNESLFNDFLIPELTKWKWIVSIFFTVTISLLTIFSLYNWFKDLDYTKFIISLYIVASGIIVLVSLIAFLMNSFNAVSPFLRRIFGVIHSPIPLFIFFLLYLAKKKDK
jgi:hypothetical protein